MSDAARTSTVPAANQRAAPVESTSPPGTAARSTDDTWLPHEAWLATLPRHYVGAAALVTDEAGRVLLLKPSYRAGWLLPGGTLDHGEDPAACVVREVAEETGLHVEAGRVLDIDWRPPDPEADGAMAGPALQLIFDAGTVPSDTAIRLDEESLAWRWVTLAEAAALQGPAGHARLNRACQARATGATGYGVSARGALD